MGEIGNPNSFWYRVGSAIGSGAAGEQIQRAAAPTSVTIGELKFRCNMLCYQSAFILNDFSYAGSTLITC